VAVVETGVARSVSVVSLRPAAITAAVCSAGAAIYGATQADPLPITAIVLSGAPVIAVILWLQKDARRTGVGAVHDLGMFLWFTWPVAIPWYAFKTRGPGGWKLALGLIALCLSASAIGGLAAWLVHG
jgi:hypothetical protein